jgi:hypothetical protein
VLPHHFAKTIVQFAFHCGANPCIVKRMLYADFNRHGFRKTSGCGAQSAMSSYSWTLAAVPASLLSIADVCSAKNPEVPSTV